MHRNNQALMQFLNLQQNDQVTIGKIVTYV